MIAMRNIGGWWVIRFKGVAYYTFTRDIGEAIAYAYEKNGAEVDYSQ